MYRQRRKIRRISREEFTSTFFLDEVYHPHQPIVVEGWLDPSQTGARWSAESLAQRFGDRRVEVKIFEGEPRKHGLRFKGLCKGSLQMTFSEFLKLSVEAFNGGQTHYLRLAKSSREIPELFDDIHFPDFFSEEGTGIDDWSVVDTLIRIGAKSYEYPAHCDGFENFLVQLSGRKHIVFFEPSEVSRLYLDSDDLHRSSVDDVDEPDLARFPKFEQTSPLNCTLNPGDLLYIPVLWFHNVRGEGWCVSTSRYHVQPDKLKYIEGFKPPAWQRYEQQYGVRIY